jgi:DNA repair exonuclease SbcCD ATPase subunit
MQILQANGIIFKSLSIKNGRVFDDVNISLENQGLVSIQGDNGVGKSSLWDILETIIYGSTPDGYKKDDLTKNDDDCEYKLVMEKNGEPVVAILQRKNKKWSYDIQKGNTPRTDHAYFDAIKTVTNLVGLTKDEFEGSVHLTQSAQHMLIKGSLSERKDYISAFFGIDNRYDEVHVAAKAELEKVSDKIQRLSGLSHSKQMLETELKNMEEKEIEPLQNKLKTLQTALDNTTASLKSIDEKLVVWDGYKKYYPVASEYEDPENKLKIVEEKLSDYNSKLMYAKQIHEQNKKADINNVKLDKILCSIQNLKYRNSNLETDSTPLSSLEEELSDLQAIKNQNYSVLTLRNELVSLPETKEIPIKKIEEELVNLQVAYQTHLKNKNAKEKGICPECGSKFTVQEVKKEIEILKELKDNLDILNHDYQIIKTRNQNAKRRAWVLEQLKNVPEFSEDHNTRITYLLTYIPVKKEYEDLVSKSKMLTRMEMNSDINTSKVFSEIERLTAIKGKLDACILARKMLPQVPVETESDLRIMKVEAHNQILNLKTFINSTSQTIGEYRTINESRARLITQLKDIESKLYLLDDLKRDEYFWTKMVESYGPKGLRIHQLEKMMDLILMHLPVYVSILFNEKNLTFTHKVDANNVKILAAREILNDKGKVINKFQHDIGCFSGGEKDLMSTAFILTLADCIPVNKRSNILILDEVDAQLDEGIKFRFTNELLPMLKKKYSSIFVISHDRNVQLANIYDQIWSITKNNHKSELQIQTLN